MSTVDAVHIPQLYSIYQKVEISGQTHWIGTHRLPISSALKADREFRENGYPVIWRKEGEYGPTHKD